jgi:Skp family chaperone for outer membrane proteins
MLPFLSRQSAKAWSHRHGCMPKCDGFRFLHVKTDTDTATSTADKPDLVGLLQSLERGIAARTTVNSDLLLDNLRQLHKQRVNIPVTYFMDTASILCGRDDQLRAELLIHLFRDNVQLSRQDTATRNPGFANERKDPLRRLVTQTISLLHEKGSAESAAMFWVKMSNSGFKTDRATMETILEHVARNPRSAASLEFINSFHTAMQAHLWHQTPAYYGRLLRVLRHHVQVRCNSYQTVRTALAKLDELWGDAQRAIVMEDPTVSHLTTALPLELYALRVSIYAAAMRALASRGASPEHKDAVWCREQSSQAFEAFLEQCRVEGDLLQRTGGCDDHTAQALAEEIHAILTGTREATSLPLPAVVKAGHSVDSAALTYAQQYVRGSVHRLLRELAAEGMATEAVTLLGVFLNARRVAPSAPTATSSGAAVQTPKSTTRLDMQSDAVNSILASLQARSKKVGDHSHAVVTTVSSEDALAERRRADERTWQAELVCSLLRNSDTARSALQRGDANVLQSTIQGLDDVYQQLTAHLVEHQLKPGARFYAAYVTALGKNVHTLQQELQRRAQSNAAKSQRRNVSAQPVRTVQWSEAVNAADRFLASAPRSVLGSVEVTEALIGLLCGGAGKGGQGAEEIEKAYELLVTATKRGVSLSGQTHSALLEAATLALDDQQLSAVLSAVEAVLRQTAQRKQDHGERDVHDRGVRGLLRQRIYAHCRLRRAYPALELLRELKELGETPEVRIYHWILRALYETFPRGSEQWQVFLHPTKTVDFMIREMEKDGRVLTSYDFTLLLRLYSATLRYHARQVKLARLRQQQADSRRRERAAEAGYNPDGVGSGDKGSSDADRNAETHAGAVDLMLREMGRMLQRFPHLVDASAIREVTKAHCILGEPTIALETMEGLFHMYKVPRSAVAYEQLVHYHAVVEGNLNAAEDVLMSLVNNSLRPTDAIVASFVVGHMRHGELSEALDVIQDMHNQHRILPPTAVWCGLLDASLAKGDAMEARRVVFLLKQLYSAEQRAAIIGWALPSEPFSPPSESAEEEDSANSGAPRLSKSARFMRRLREVEDMEEGLSSADQVLSGAHLRRQAALAEYWNPKPKQAWDGTVHRDDRDRSDVDSDAEENGDEDDAAEENVGAAQPALLPGYMIRLGVPIGRAQRGALSDNGLARRFEYYGLQL